MKDYTNLMNYPFIILAGGFGKRLQSINNKLPKPMVNICGKPFLEHLLLYLKFIGFRKFIICVYHMSDVIKSYFNDGEKWNISITYSDESKPLGTAGAIGNINNLNDKYFWVSNGDSFIDFNPSEMINIQKKQKTIGTLLLANGDNEYEYGNVVMGHDFNIIEFKEKKNIKYKSCINAGIYFFKKEILDYIPMNKNFSLEYELLPMLIEKKIKLSGYFVESILYDIGTPNRLDIFKKKIYDNL